MSISNLTMAEHYRLFGTLSEQHVEEVLAKGLDDFDPSDVSVHINEAMCGMYSEDFLAHHINSLYEFKKRLRGQNREALQDIINEMESSAQDLFNEGDYARDELRKALSALPQE